MWKLVIDAVLCRNFEKNQTVEPADTYPEQILECEVIGRRLRHVRRVIQSFSPVRAMEVGHRFGFVSSWGHFDSV